MTKRDYEAFAAMLYQYRIRMRAALASEMSTRGQKTACKNKLKFLDDIEEDICRIFRADNQRFDPIKFKRATGRYDEDAT